MTVPLHVRVVGTGPPVLVLHGLFGSGTNWRSVARRLRERYRWLLVDLRNHGESPHAPGMDYATLAADVLALLDREGLARAALIGHSMGGKTAMRVALDRRERVERLAVIDVAPAPSAHDHLPLLDALAGLPLTGAASRAELDARLARAIPDAGLRAFLLQNLARDAAGFRWRIDLAAIRAALPDLLAFPATPGARYAGPVLFVRGARSDYVRPEHEAEIRARFPRAEIVTVEGAGHWVHAERPDEVVRRLDAFLAAP